MCPNVLLINPWITDFAAFDLWARPLGLLYLSSMLKNRGAETRLIDCLDRLHPHSGAPARKKRWAPGTGQWLRTILPTPEPLAEIPRAFSRYGMPEEAFRRALTDGPRPDAVFVTSIMTYWYPGVFRAIEIVKSELPGVPVLLGGIYATLSTEHAKAESGADRVIRGPAENSWPDIAETIGLQPDSPPLTWQELRPDLDLYPKLEFAPLMTSRGCVLRCPYCASGRLFPNYLQRPADDVLDEIRERYDRLGIRHFTFFDDALLADAENHIMPILEGVVRREMNISFHCPNGLHVGSITPELAGLMKRAGFKTLRLGVESLDPGRQKKLGNKVVGGWFESAMDNLKTAGFGPENIGVYILFGLPGQNLDEVLTTAKVVREAGARPYLAEYSPLPGTPLWKEAVAASSFDLAGEPLYQNNTFFPCREKGFDWERVWEIKRTGREG